MNACQDSCPIGWRKDTSLRNRIIHMCSCPLYHCSFFKKFIYLLFLERGEGREKERERNLIMWLPVMWPQLGTWPATQACALTGNRTGNPSVCSLRSIHWATPTRATLYCHSYCVEAAKKHLCNEIWRWFTDLAGLREPYGGTSSLQSLLLCSEL